MNSQDDMRRWTGAFLRYAEAFGDNDPRYRLKRIHTLGVLGYMNALLKLEGLDQTQPDLANLARIAAVFHDIGRFEQLRQYGTFFDSRSVDHAALSVRILQETDMLANLDADSRRRVMEAIAWHNRLEVRLPDPQTRLVCDLLRDADRLDIFRVFATEDIQDTTAHTLQEAWDAPVADKVKSALLSGKCVNKADRQSAMDIWLTYLGFVNDFHFSAAYRLCMAAGFWRRRFDALPQADPAVVACVSHAEALLNENCRRTETDSQPDRGTSLSGV